MHNNDYLNDPQINYGSSPSSLRYSPYPTTSKLGTLKTTWYAVGLFALSFLIFFAMGMSNNIMWMVSMGVGIIASIFAIKGAVDSKGAVSAIIVAIIATIPALLSCCFLLIALIAHLDRAAG
jgi:hypothetical protein